MGVAGNTLGRRFEDAVYYARQQRRAHIEFTATFTSDQISQWTEMIQDWNNDASQPDPFQEPDQGSYLFCLRRPPRHADLAPVSRLLKCDANSHRKKKTNWPSA